MAKPVGQPSGWAALGMRAYAEVVQCRPELRALLNLPRIVGDVNGMRRLLLKPASHPSPWRLRIIRRRDRCMDVAVAAVGLIVTDYHMPGLNGVDVAKHARERHPAIPVLFVSARTDVLAEAGAPKPYTTLRKPFEMRELVSAVGKLAEEYER